jgi:hypothetical protein
MIRVTRLNSSPLILNSDLVGHIETTPDTVIALTHSRHYRCGARAHPGDEAPGRRIVGHGIAGAVVATVCGVGSANIFSSQ